MRLSHIFERLLLKEILKMGESRTGRPAKLGDEEALKCVFKVLRTGMQWREVDASVSFVFKGGRRARSIEMFPLF